MLQNENALSASAGSVFYLSSFFFRQSETQTCHFQRTDCMSLYQRHLRMVHCKTTRLMLSEYSISSEHTICKVILLCRTNRRNVSAAELSYQNIWGLERTLCYCCTRAILLHVNREGCGHSTAEWELFIAKFSKQIYFVRRNPLLACLFTSVF
jgi:hypothetical protein